ncbi:MAG: hypothetical protein H0W84_02015 [Bacteroidetes bacterium]|nr:hypothetical protein [Bacteroidota bacterium]
MREALLIGREVLRKGGSSTDVVQATIKFFLFLIVCIRLWPRDEIEVIQFLPF